MRKLLTAVFLSALIGQAFAQTQGDQDHRKGAAAAAPCVAGAGASRQNEDKASDDRDRRDGGAVIMPCGAAAASAAASGNLTPVYIGAGVVAAGVIAAGIHGGDSGRRNDGPGTGGGTGGTTGTTGTTR